VRFLSYLCLYICLGSSARSRLSCSAVALTVRWSATTSTAITTPLRQAGGFQLLMKCVPSRQSVRQLWTMEELRSGQASVLANTVDRSTCQSYSTLNSWVSFVDMHHFPFEPTTENSILFHCLYVASLLSSEFGRRCWVRSHARRWLQLVGCAALLLDASNFGGSDGVGESRIEPRRSLRKTRAS